MSEIPSRLNLIQRAMQKAASQIPNSPRPDAPAERQVANDWPRVTPQEPGEVPGKTAQGRKASPVHLDVARLRAMRILSLDERGSPTFAEFKTIKRELLQLARSADAKSMSNNTFLVTSALPGEGKTFTTMNLAMSLAFDRELHVVVLDGDFMRATLGSCFEGPHEAGLVDLLTGDCNSVDEVLHDCVEYPNLHVMFAGAHRDISMEMFAGRRMSEICSALSARFLPSIVLIDTPPLLVSSEILALSSDINHVVMVVAAGHASSQQIEQALQVVAKCRSINFLFNKAPEWQKSEYSYYYYNYKGPPSAGPTERGKN